MATAYQELISDDDEVVYRRYNFRTLVRKKGILDRWEYHQGEGVPFLRRVLTRVDVHSFGLCMTIGAGIFVIAGSVAQDVGPAVVLSFLLSGIAALIASFSYSEFSSRVPACGSTYSYIYVSLGEFMGWIAGWITILEYAGAATVAHGIAKMVIKVAEAFSVDMLDGKLKEQGLNRVIATGLISFLTLLVLFIGIKGSARVSRVMSVTNITTILFICIAGSIHVYTPNWKLFKDYGIKQIVKGAAKVFFAYTGFENSTTLATEVKDPKRYMPTGLIMTLATAITLYMLSSLIITGMLPPDLIDTTAPFFVAFKDLDIAWAAAIVGIASLLCMTATIFTTLVGLPRILFQMSRDGLLLELFSRLNSFKVPFFGTVIFGAIACLLSVLPIPDFTDLVSIGVLINYSMMNIGVIRLRFLDVEKKVEKKHALTLIATILSCILVGLAFQCPVPHYHIAVPISLIPFIICIGLLYTFLPVHALARPPNVDSFLTPLVPLIPCVGTLLNVIMIVELGTAIKPLWLIGIWLVVGSIVYFAYGMRHSRLNFVKSTDQFYY